jgi:hypothetical protein
LKLWSKLNLWAPAHSASLFFIGNFLKINFSKIPFCQNFSELLCPRDSEGM